jgi:predicted transcriptional regulator of viral defense system
VAAVAKALQRSAKRGRIIKLKEYFYAIVPLEYRAAGAPPAPWFIRDLMAAMSLPYYVGLLSAAALHGASHQQPQEFQVLTDRSTRPISSGRTRIRFYASQYLAHAATMDVKTPTGSMRVSTPETTAIDLVRFARSVGHLDHVAGVLAELAPVLDAKRLLAAVRVVRDLPNAQRLGYILDQVHQRRLSDPLHIWLESHALRTQPLRTGQPVEGSRENRRWHLWIASPLEVAA